MHLNFRKRSYYKVVALANFIFLDCSHFWVCNTLFLISKKVLFLPTVRSNLLHTFENARLHGLLETGHTKHVKMLSRLLHTGNQNIKRAKFYGICLNHCNLRKISIHRCTFSFQCFMYLLCIINGFIMYNNGI